MIVSHTRVQSRLGAIYNKRGILGLSDEIIKTAIISIVSMAAGGFITWRTVKYKIEVLCDTVRELKVKVDAIEQSQAKTQLKITEDLGAIRETLGRIDERTSQRQEYPSS
jgi:hypothetical protein